jgi:hypothetical protein
MPLQRTPDREDPRDEPEIIFPNRRFGRFAKGPCGVRILVAGGRGQRIYSAKPGPLAALIAAIVLGALSVTALMIVLGIFLIWIPVIGVLAAALVVSGLLRGYSRRFR